MDLVIIETANYKRKFVMFGKRSNFKDYENMQDYADREIVTLIPIDKQGMKIILKGE